MRAGNESRSATERRLTLLGYGAYGLLGWTSVLLPSLIGEIQDSFDRTDADFGLIYFFAALLYGLGGLGGGFLTERIGPRLVLAGAFILLGVTLFGSSVLTVWVMFAATVSIGKAANGSLDAGFGALFLDVFADRRGSALNLLHLCYAVGALLAPVAIGVAVSQGVDWRVIFGIGVIGAGAGLISLLRLDWSTVRHSQHTSMNETEPGGIWGAPFFFLAATMTLYDAQVVGITSWIVRYLEDDGIGIATTALSAFWVGVCISRFLAPRLTALTTTARLGFILLTGTTLLFLVALLVPWTAVTIVLLVAAGFFSGPGLSAADRNWRRSLPGSPRSDERRNDRRRDPRCPDLPAPDRRHLNPLLAPCWPDRSRRPRFPSHPRPCPGFP